MIYPSWGPQSANNSFCWVFGVASYVFPVRYVRSILATFSILDSSHLMDVSVECDTHSPQSTHTFHNVKNRAEIKQIEMSQCDADLWMNECVNECTHDRVLLLIPRTIESILWNCKYFCNFFNFIDWVQWVIERGCYERSAYTILIGFPNLEGLRTRIYLIIFDWEK